MENGMAGSWLLSLAWLGVFGKLLDWTLVVGPILWRHRGEIAAYVDLGLVASIVLGAAALVAAIQLVAFAMFLFDTSGKGEYGVGRPLIFPCKTTHRRIFPQKHAFAYSYLVVGIPVGWKGSVGGLLSAERPVASRVGALLRPRWTAWFEVRAEDHMRRGSHGRGLRGKLDEFLESEGVDPLKYPFAYLVTAPRFLGYSFNPVSFWYLYGKEKELSAVVCEVNNTFDERRPYFLAREEETPSPLLEANTKSRSTTGTTGSPDEKQLGKTPNGSTRSSKIQRSWAKDFHVSPFNSRKGFYSILARDPLSHDDGTGGGHVDTTITLASSKKHPKIVARLFSAGDPLDPAAMTPWQKLKLLLTWWWVGLVTFPRIVKEAAALFYRRGLHVWYRPEPLSTNLGRRASKEELRLEELFREYLRYLVRQQAAAVPLRVVYVPSGSDDALAETMKSPSVETTTTTTTRPTTTTTTTTTKYVPVQELEFKVLTPAFYARFVQYAHDFEAIFSEFRESATITVSNPEALPNLVLKKPAPPLNKVRLVDLLYFKLIKSLRRRPAPIERPLTSSAVPEKACAAAADIRDFRLSSMDGYMLTEADGRSRRAYRALVAKVLVAERLALGSMEVLWVEVLLLRVAVATVISAALEPIFVRVLGG